MMEHLTLQRIAGLITATAGLRMRESDYPQLAETVGKRVKSCGFTTLEEYYSHLMEELEMGAGWRSPLPLNAAPQSEWHRLFTHLTINESYFFRDQNQFNLLTRTILPELISRKQRQHSPGAGSLPSLRIWSAGCSTGEELYSIAIALDELNFPWQEWRTLLIGTDISLAALAIAQQGVYGNWSFRQTESARQRQYFRLRHPGLQVRDDLRQRVTFQYGNLVQDAFPAVNSALQEIDLIICRNVFIYFDSGAIAQTLAKFHRALAPEGYLITGHTELQGQDTHQFHLKVFPESLVYQRRAEPLGVTPQPAATRSPAVAQGSWLTGVALSSQRPAASGVSGSPTVALPSRPAPPAPPPPEPAAPPDAIAIALAAAQASLAQKAYLAAIQAAEAICAAVPDHFEAQLILAKAHANRGNHNQAAKVCQQALRLQPLSLELHYLAAQIAEERGDLDGAKEHLRRIIYLDAGEFKAYLDLASLYQRERRFDQVKKMEQLALKTLNLLPTTAIVDAEDGTTVLDWRHYLESKLAG